MITCTPCRLADGFRHGFINRLRLAATPHKERHQSTPRGVTGIDKFGLSAHTPPCGDHSWGCAVRVWVTKGSRGFRRRASSAAGLGLLLTAALLLRAYGETLPGTSPDLNPPDEVYCPQCGRPVKPVLTKNGWQCPINPNHLLSDT
jgi:hypothetical protein